MTRGIPEPTDVVMKKKIPTAFQALFGFCLVGIGFFLMWNSQVFGKAMASSPEVITIINFAFLGALYLINGVPSLIEGVMTMNAEYEQRKTDLEVGKKG